MKKLFTLLLLMIAGYVATASHLMGGQISARQISNTSLTYEVTIRLFRDVMGINMSAPQLRVYPGNSNQYTTTITTLSGSGIVNGFQYPTEWYVYKDTITFPSAGQYRLAYYECCRNAAIVNTTNSETMFLETNLTVYPVGTSNSSPEFLLDPVGFVPLNQQWLSNPLAYDADGDSLAFRIDTPFSNLNVNVGNYTFPASVASGMLNVNGFTGEIRWTPSNVGNFIFSYVVDEYRNGQLIGSVVRDYQYVVMSSNNTPPVPLATSVNGPVISTVNGVTTANFPAGQSGSITLTYTDNNNDSLVMQAFGRHFLPGSSLPATFNFVQLDAQPGVSTTRFVRGTLNWSPSATANDPANNWTCVFRVSDITNGVRFFRDETILIRATTTTGVNNPSLSPVSLYPNPAVSGNWNLGFNLNNSADIRIKITDLQGRIIFNDYYGNYPAGQHVIVRQDALSNGLYLVEVEANGQAIAKEKLLIK